MRKSVLTILLAILLAACDAIAAPTPTSTPTSTATATITPSATPSATATQTETPTLTPTASATPTATFTPTITRTPSITPLPSVGFLFDNWERVEVPAIVRGGATQALIVFINNNDQQSIGNIATAQPATNVQTVFAVSPASPGNRVELLQVSAATGNQIYLSPDGRSIAYFKQDAGATGLYVLNMDIGLSGRIAQINSLVQRGFFSTPAWSPSGDQLALSLETGYSLDIFLYANDGSGRINLTESGAYEFWPTWSPDGTQIAFVSDRDTCPSWVPGEAGACDALTQPAPIGGGLYVIDPITRNTRRITDETVTDPPRWINNELIAYATGDQNDLLNPQRKIRLANVNTGEIIAIALAENEDALYLSDAWAPDGSAVVFQRVTPNQTEIIMMRTSGEIIRRRSDDLLFPRFGLSAAWSPAGDRIALGGVDGQCPYGVRVTDTSFDFVATGNPPPSMCNPVFSPDGQNLVFAGINPNVDGRVDLYSANFNGFGASNLTVNLRGQISLLGWIAPQ